MGLRRGIPLLLTAVLLTACATPSTPTQGQRADVSRYVQSRLDDAWRGDGRYDRPPAVATRFLLPNGWGFAMANCMVSAGFNAYDYDSSTGFTNGLERTSPVGEEGLAWYNCGARFPTYDTMFSDPDDAQLDELYAYYRDRLIPCLALKGYPVAGVPSREEFGVGEPGQPGSWNPYLTAEPPSSIAIASALLDSCTPYPEGWSSTVGARP